MRLVAANSTPFAVHSTQLTQSHPPSTLSGRVRLGRIRTHGPAQRDAQKAGPAFVYYPPAILAPMVNYGYYPAPAIADAANLQFRRLANTIACAAETAKNSYPASPNTGEKSTPSTASEKEHPNTIRVLLRTRPPRRVRTRRHAVHRKPVTANKIRSRTLLQVIHHPSRPPGSIAGQSAHRHPAAGFGGVRRRR